MSGAKDAPLEVTTGRGKVKSIEYLGSGIAK
jgi:hypothetical protein